MRTWIPRVELAMFSHGISLIRLLLAVQILLVLASPGDAQAPETPRLLVAVREVPPFAFKGDDGTWSGISIDLLHEIKAHLDDGAENETELEFREMSLQEMLAAVEHGKVDLAVAALTVNLEREKLMDFTHAFHSSGLGIAVSGQRAHGWGGVVSAIFSPTFLKVVGGLFAVLLVSGVAVYFFERRRNTEFAGGTMKGVASGIWWAAVTMTTVGYGDKVPKSAGGRVIAGIWMFSGLFIVASFTAAVTSALTVTQLRSPIAGPRDLSKVRVATVEASTSQNYLRSRHIIGKTYSDIRPALIALRENEADAVVYDAAILRYEAHQHFAGEVHVLSVTFEPQNYAFALPTDSPLRESVNQALLREIASPEWREKLVNYLGEPY